MNLTSEEFEQLTALLLRFIDSEAFSEVRKKDDESNIIYLIDDIIPAAEVHIRDQEEQEAEKESAEWDREKSYLRWTQR